MASIVVFALLNLLPGDVAGVILGPNASQQSIDALREQLGLNQNIVPRYVEWLGAMLTGDLGSSALTGAPVNPVVADKFGVTLSLVLFGMLAAVLIALPLGILAALRRGRADGVLISGFSQLGIAIPASSWVSRSAWWWVQLHWLPANGYVPIRVIRAVAVPPDSAGADAGWSVHGAGACVRSAFIDVISQTTTDRACDRASRPDRTARVAQLQIVTVLGLQLSTLFVGAIVVESVFVLPGLGSYLVQMVGNRDLPVVQSIVMILVALVLVINLLVDLSYTLIDPRLRAGEDEVDD